MKKKIHCKKFTPNWDKKCANCGASPIVPVTKMCGPCTWGESDTVMGDWEDVIEERCEDCDGTCQEA